MKKSMTSLEAILQTLTRTARSLGISDAQWAERAGVRKETLSRLRRRTSCDFATLEALARAVDLTPGLLDLPVTKSDGQVPTQMDRTCEERLVELCASGDLEPARWAASGPAFFMAGLAVMLAGAAGHDRQGLLDLAEQLHAGASLPQVFALWLERSPVRPSRFLPLVAARV